jgi:DNA invertase Pin-like site-specific DNA recombinase
MGIPPLVRAYLRASTEEQDALRARGALLAFAEAHGQRIACFYPENESGATLHRPELFRLLNDSQPGDILLCEQVDRLSRLNKVDWETLRGIIQSKGIHIVSLDLPTSHQLIKGNTDTFEGRMLGAMNGMLLDMLAAIARKDYDDRRRRSLEGIEKAKAANKYKGRKIDTELHARIKSCLDTGMPIRRTAHVCGCAKSTVQRVLTMLQVKEPEPA